MSDELYVPTAVVVAILLVIGWVAVQRQRAAGAPNAKQLKIVAVGLLAIPAVLLAILAIGELGSGDLAGLQHVPEALVVALVAALAWRYPKRVGAVLLVGSVVLAAAWLGLSLTAERHDSAATLALVAAMLFLPPLAAGALLYEAGRGLPGGPPRPAT